MTIGIASSFLTLTAFLLWVTQKVRKTTYGTPIVIASIALACALPIYGMVAPFYIRGLLGDLSITSQLLLLIYIVSTFYPAHLPSPTLIDKHRFSVLIIIASLALYPASLGLSLYDPYEMGFPASSNHWGLLAATYIVCLYLWFRRSYWHTGILVIATLAFYTNLLESRNYWDYILDPPIVIASILSLLRCLFQKGRRTTVYNHKHQ